LDFQFLINLGASGVLGVIGYFVRENKQEMKEIREGLAAFRLKAAEEYVTSADLKKIEDYLIRIEALLHTKADK